MKKETDNEEEKLRAVLKNDSFRVPPGYFEELPGKVMDQINALPDFEKTSPINPFEVPENYFEDLPGIVSDKISNATDRKMRPSFFPEWIRAIQRPRIAIPIAFATIVLLAGLFFMKQKTDKLQPSEEFTSQDLSDSYFLQTMDEELFVDVLAGQSEDTTNDNLEQYLIDNNIELSQIENAL